MMFVYYMSYSYMKYACVYNIHVSEINNNKKKEKKRSDIDELYIFKILLKNFTPDKRQLKMSILSTHVDQKSLETEFSIVIHCPIVR